MAVFPDKPRIMVFENFAEFKQHEGKDLPPTEWITVTQDMINAFADATLDFQWIHVDVDRAKKESPFGGPIAHGFMSVSLLSKFVESSVTIKSAKMGVNYGLDKIRFPHPVPAGCRLRAHINVAKVEDYPNNGVKTFWQSKIEIEGVDKPACIATFISLAFE